LREEPHVLYLEAIAAYRVGDVSKAVSLQKKAITANSRGIGYHANLCLYARTLGDIELAVDSGRRACNMFPNDPAALNNYANALKDAKRFDIALTQYEKTYKLRPFYLNPIKQGLTIARALFNQTAALNWETRLSDALRAPESTLIANNTPAHIAHRRLTAKT
jgi:tetratricopeptide (TPR) repeat protein